MTSGSTEQSSYASWLLDASTTSSLDTMATSGPPGRTTTSPRSTVVARGWIVGRLRTYAAARGSQSHSQPRT